MNIPLSKECRAQMKSKQICELEPLQLLLVMIREMLSFLQKYSCMTRRYKQARREFIEPTSSETLRLFNPMIMYATRGCPHYAVATAERKLSIVQAIKLTRLR